MSIVLLGLLHLLALDGPKDGLTDQAQKLREKSHHALLVEYFADEAAGMGPRWDYYAPRFMKEIAADPSDWVGFDGLFWLVTAGRLDRPEFSQAMALLTKHHAKGNRIQRLCEWFVSPLYFASASDAVEGLLREVMATNPNRPVQAEACFCLAQYLSNKAEFARELRRPEGAGLARRIGDRWGQEYLARLKACDPDQLANEAAHQVIRGRVAYAQYWANHLVFGKRAPMISAPDVDGKPMALSDHQGKVVMLSFWGTWCTACVAMIPHERSLVERFAGRPFVMLGVAHDNDRGTVKKMVEDKHITWRSWWDTENPSAPISRFWDVSGWPTTYILDHHGMIRYKNIRGQDLDFAIDALMIARNPSENQKRGQTKNRE